MEKNESLIGRIPVEVNIDLSWKTLLENEGAGLLKNLISGFVKEIISDLALPVGLDVELSSIQLDGRSFTVSINGEPCRMPFSLQIPNETKLRALAIKIARVVYENRENLISDTIADNIRNAWSLEEKGIYLPELSQSDFFDYLRMLVRCGFRINRGDHLDGHPLRLSKQWSAGNCFEEAVGSLDSLQVVLYRFPGTLSQPGFADDMPIEKMLKMMQDGLFYEIGVRIPRVEIQEDAKLEENENRVRINDLRLPPFLNLNDNEFLVNDTVSRLNQLDIKIKSRKAINPVSGSECAIVHDTNGNSAKICEQAGLLTWGRNGYAILELSSQLRRYVASFILLDSVEYDLDRLNEMFPALISAVKNRFELHTIVQILRHLVDEGISFRNLRGVLESLLGARTTINADFNKYIVFAPYAMVPYPTSEGIKIEDVDAAGYAECVRINFKRYISNKYTRGGNTLVVYLLDRSIELRIAESDKNPLREEERKNLLGAVWSEVGDLPPTAQNPIILTSLEVRKRFRRLIEVEFPHLAVVSYQELSPDINIQTIARISWK